MILKDKVVVVTGASSGIGEEIARQFASRECAVILLARRIEKLAKIQRTLPGSFAMKCDVRSEKDVKKAFTAIKNLYGRIDVLVNNAGVGKYGSFEEQSIADMRDQMETNYFGIIHCIKHALPLMKRGSKVVNVSSILGKVGIPGMSSYVATKFAVTGLSEVLYYELDKKGIRLHCIYPAAIKTNFFDDTSFAPYLRNLHSGVWTEPQQVAKAVISSIVSNKTEMYIPFYIKYWVKARSLFPSFFRFAERRFYSDKF